MAAGAIVETACLVCGSGEVGTAKCFKLTESIIIISYYNDVETEWAKHSLPPMNKAVEWTVYRLSSTKMFKHHSLFFVCESPQHETSGFTFELGIGKQGTQSTVIPVTNCFPRSKFTSENLSSLGTVTGYSAEDIMDRGLLCLAHFGDYNEHSLNCQDFCSKLAKELGLKQPWTDAEKVVTLGAVLIAAGAICLAALRSRRSSQK